jgi:response regulator RpfG family c-di-GMP phosphodiesterase
MEKIKSEQGHHFEPRVVEAMLRVLPECLAVRERYKD